MCIKFSMIVGVVSVGLLIPSVVNAQTPSAQFTVQITIAGACQINSATNMDFGLHGVLATNSDATSVITVQCTNTTPFNIGLSAGSGSSATVANRLMTGTGGATVAYSLYQTAARDTVWGTTVGTDTVSGTGTGAAQQYTVYGRALPQNTPAPGVYTDTVTATITY
ncbi:spore coat U domain-containing protein [Ochrobactrum sp. AN78]|uniref:Csu type fimbrial protein n=1 Tax=Ochrobactrum sp. AN78 TaxID=3039853 RepID=UPI0021F7BA58|nr:MULTISPECIES: spore coat U domain-containing protein [Brucella/Ochrobactrum group]MCV9907825.1 spore coat U domain-containing protein [Brucella sp. HL-2]MDH7792080.1 spore coat protein U-like protein [Ochrobactrum sp. AN78]